MNTFETWRLPDLGEGIQNARLVHKLVHIGDEVEEDQDFADLETDKAAVTIPSPFSGIVVHWHVEEGDSVEVGDDVMTALVTKANNSLVDPTAIAIRNLELIKPKKIAVGKFSHCHDMITEVQNIAVKFQSLNRSRLAAEHRKQLLRSLYEAWSPIVVVRKLNAGMEADERLITKTEGIWKDRYPSYVKSLRELLSHTKKHQKPRIFIGSSMSALETAEEVQRQLAATFSCSLWKDNPVFELNTSTLDSLLRAIEEYDFGLFVFAPDDRLTRVGESRLVPRDNVIFEYGLFLGKLGKSRAFIIQARESSILSDLDGIMTARFDSDATDLHAELGAACSKIKATILREWELAASG